MNAPVDTVAARTLRRPPEEVEIRAVLRAIWHTRYFALTGGLIAAIAIVGALAFLRAALPAQQIFQYPIHFVFDGLDRGQYPNARPFSPNDLISPVVLQRVFETNKLNEFGIKLSEFSSAISVRPYSPLYGEAVSAFRGRLENKRLTFVEQQKIEKEMEKELEAISGKNALIIFVVNKHVGISENLGLKVVDNIAETWAQMSIAQLGVLNLPEGLDVKDLIDTTEFTNLDYPIAVQTLETGIRDFFASLDQLGTFGGAGSIVDPRTGHTVASLYRSLKEIRDNKIRGLMGPVQYLGLARDATWSRLHFLMQIELLKQEKDLLEESAAKIRNAFDQYTNSSSRRQTAVANAPASLPSAQPTQQPSSLAQFSDTFLDRILALAESKEDRLYRQTLLNEQLKLENRAASVDNEIRRLQSAVEPVNAGTDTGRDKPDPTLLADRFTKNLADAVKELNELWRVRGRLFDQLSAARLSYSGRLYVGLDMPSRERYVWSHPILNANILVLALAAMIAASAVAGIIGLIVQGVRRPTLKKPEQA
jgi:hypothetical protein